MPKSKEPREIPVPVDDDIEMTYVYVGEPNLKQFDVRDKEGMPRYILTAKIINPTAPEYGGSLQEILDDIAERGWRHAGSFSAGVNKAVWILWRPKKAV